MCEQKAVADQRSLAELQATLGDHLRDGDPAVLRLDAKRLGALAGGLWAIECPPPLVVYRLTKHHKIVPKDIGEIWYPPEPLSRLRRANIPGRSVFYGALHESTPFAEVQTCPGDMVVLAKWVTTRTVRLIVIGPPEFKRRFPLAKAPEQVSADQQAGLDFLVSVFARADEVAHGLAAWLAEDFYRAEGPAKTALDDVQVSGILYPSAKEQFGINIGLQSCVAENNLRLETAKVVLVRARDTAVIDVSDPICELTEVRGRELVWKYLGFPVCTLMPPGGPWPDMSVGDCFCVPCDGVFGCPDGTEYSLHAGYSITRTVLGYEIRDLQANIVGFIVDPIPEALP